MATSTGPRTDRYPSRIVCLTEETTETLYLLERTGASSASPASRCGRRARAGRSRRSRRSRARRSTRIRRAAAGPGARILRPAGRHRRANWCGSGIERASSSISASVAEHPAMIRVLGGMIGCEAKADALAARLRAGLDEVRAAAARFARAAARVFRGMGRAADLRHPLGVGADRHRRRRRLFPRASAQHVARQGPHHRRPARSARGAAPDIILGSWCGKKFQPDTVAARPGWERGAGRARGASCTRSSRRSSCSRARRR